MSKIKQLYDFINIGGPINWILFSILCFCICQCIERCIYFFQTRKGSKKDVLIRMQNYAQKLTDENIADEIKKKEMVKESTLLYYEMNRGLWFLNFISAVAPSLGLLGTVTGLIGAFKAIAKAGSQVNMQDLSGGIWEAMLTTAFGMIISIPALLFYRTFKRIIEKRVMAIGIWGTEGVLPEKNCPFHIKKLDKKQKKEKKNA